MTSSPEIARLTWHTRDTVQKISGPPFPTKIQNNLFQDSNVLAQSGFPTTFFFLSFNFVVIAFLRTLSFILWAATRIDGSLSISHPTKGANNQINGNIVLTGKWHFSNKAQHSNFSTPSIRFLVKRDYSPVRVLRRWRVFFAPPWSNLPAPRQHILHLLENAQWCCLYNQRSAQRWPQYPRPNGSSLGAFPNPNGQRCCNTQTTWQRIPVGASSTRSHYLGRHNHQKSKWEMTRRWAFLKHPSLISKLWDCIPLHHQDVPAFLEAHSFMRHLY